MAERILVDPSALIRLPASIDLRNAGLVEPLAVVLHGLHRIGSLKGRRLAVVGGGSVGLLAVAAALTAGAKVDLHARHEVQRKAGSALGARTDITQDYEIVIDAAGSQSAIDLASDIVAPGGSILELGMFWNAVTVSRLLLRKEVNLLPSMLYGHDHQVREFDQAATLLAALPELASVVVTHRFPLEDAARAFRVAADRRAGAIKVLLMPAIPLQF
jgi:threonine dehydrogenase-like Zn-dependent dehydrogenase